MTGFLGKISAFINGWRFATFIIALCVSMFVFLASVLLIPDSAGAVGAAVVEFKTWCFGYDPATGSFRSGYIPVMLLNPLLLAGVVGFMWSDPLREALQGAWHPVARTVGLGIGVAALLGGGLFLINPQAPTPEPIPFPAERIRTALDAPEFELSDQNGDSLRLSDLRGRVVLLTAMYTTCATACPMIMVQARRATAALPAHLQGDVTVVAITLDPENDTPQKLKEAARVHKVTAPAWRLLTGPPQVVNAVLDQMSISRQRNPTTGEIEHSNLFAVIDRQGRIAYRLTLGGSNEHWLEEALRVLAEEDLPGEKASL